MYVVKPSKFEAVHVTVVEVSYEEASNEPVGVTEGVVPPEASSNVYAPEPSVVSTWSAVPSGS